MEAIQLPRRVAFKTSSAAHSRRVGGHCHRRWRRNASLSLVLVTVGVALYHGEFAAVSALLEHRGVPVDMEVFPQLADRETWRAVRNAMVPAIDAQYGLYVRNAAGDWTFNMERFAAGPAACCAGCPSARTYQHFRLVARSNR
jgi:hypothetical protein